jgi:hypothetical protein
MAFYVFLFLSALIVSLAWLCHLYASIITFLTQE